MTLAAMLSTFGAAAYLAFNATGELPHSQPPAEGQRHTQVYGGLCQTQYGVCPLIDANGASYSAPVGSPCYCGPDPGFVIQ
jgi:hypothetical protein